MGAVLKSLTQENETNLKTSLMGIRNSGIEGTICLVSRPRPRGSGIRDLRPVGMLFFYERDENCKLEYLN